MVAELILVRSSFRLCLKTTVTRRVSEGISRYPVELQLSLAHASGFQTKPSHSVMPPPELTRRLGHTQLTFIHSPAETDAYASRPCHVEAPPRRAVRAAGGGVGGAAAAAAGPEGV
jgi:hypothetical protein